MQVQPFKFTASGQIGTAAGTKSVSSPEPYNKPFAPFTGDYTKDNSSVAVAAQPQRIAGLAYKGFTAVTVYNGVDNTGDPVMVTGGAGTYSLSYEVNCNNGLYVEVAGTGSGTVWLV